MFAGMAELADAHGSGPCGSNTMRVQVSFPAWKEVLEMGLLFLCFIGNSDLLKRKEKRMFTEHTLERYVF